MLEIVFRGIVARRTSIVVVYALLALPAARIAIGIPSDDAIERRVVVSPARDRLPAAPGRAAGLPHGPGPARG
jgi:hypothetical protein